MDSCHCLIFIFIAIGVVVYALSSYFRGAIVPGWTSLLISIWFVGGVLLIALGITGEYIGKIYVEVKRRPRYFVQETTGVPNEGDDNPIVSSNDNAS